MIPFPNKKYNIIYADPAWRYNDTRQGSGYKNPNGAGGANKHYSTMSLQEICNLDVKNISDDNCMLFLWCTSSLLDYWIKLTKDLSKPYSGMGYYTNQNAEFCLIGLKGKYWREARNIKQIIQEPRQEHSKKPDTIRNCIVELCGDLPRIELFAREKVDGWDCWGNEVNATH